MQRSTLATGPTDHQRTSVHVAVCVRRDTELFVCGPATAQPPGVRLAPATVALVRGRNVVAHRHTAAPASTKPSGSTTALHRSSDSGASISFPDGRVMASADGYRVFELRVGAARTARAVWSSLAARRGALGDPMSAEACLLEQRRQGRERLLRHALLAQDAPQVLAWRLGRAPAEFPLGEHVLHPCVRLDHGGAGIGRIAQRDSAASSACRATSASSSSATGAGSVARSSSGAVGHARATASASGGDAAGASGCASVRGGSARRPEPARPRRSLPAATTARSAAPAGRGRTPLGGIPREAAGPESDTRR